MRKTLILLALFCVWSAAAKVSLPQMFQSGMVIQREKSVPVWGTADKGERIEVTFRKKTFSTVAGEDGRWMLLLPSQKAGGPYTLTINGQQIDDVLVGDVWLCSGQSNIDVTIERVYPQYPQEIDSYDNQQVRLFRVQTDTDAHGPKSDVKPTAWRKANKREAWKFSAVGYFLGREMFAKTGVPQGVIVNSLGGSPIRAWLPADSLKERFPELFRQLQYYQDDDMVQALVKADRQVAERWSLLLDKNDPGCQLYAAPSFDDSSWKTMNQYENLTGRAEYVGSFWVRQHLRVDAAHAGQAARLLVGTLYDMDYTYLNGQEVGRTYYQYPPRRYDIPAGLLREGDNVLAVRLVTKEGNPHFIPEKPYQIVFADGTVQPLDENWLVHEGVEMSRCPQSGVNVQHVPSTLYNAMLYPLAPYALSGMLWYQGESDTDAPALYEPMLTTLVQGWRQLWGEPDLPFVIAQLANFEDPTKKPEDRGWSEVREAQRHVADSLPKTELAVLIDLGERVDIHPLRKWEVAQRVAHCFDHMLWNRKLSLSPKVKDAWVEGSKVFLTSDQPLAEKNALYEFEVAAADGLFVDASATLSEGRIVIQSPISHPAFVRYAWKNNPAHANVFGRNELPMSPFRLRLR